MAGITNGDIILDSIFIEYEVSDVSTYFEIGCPDPVTDTIVQSNTAMLTGFSQTAAKWYMQGPDDYGSQVRFTFEWALGEGLYRFNCKSYGLESYTNEGFFGDYTSATEWTAIPFPDSWFMDENGITAELRDRSKKNNREELIIRGGKPQVPYFIDTETGVEMYESEDIIEYIQANKK